MSAAAGPVIDRSNPPGVTALEQLLGRLIGAQGPIDVATFMTLALGHPTAGYYPAHVRIGADGDFVTAPEASQLFGELVGMALAGAWAAAGGSAARLVEIGPGNGTLLFDLWRATAAVPGFHAALAVDLVEPSARLRRRQAARLAHLPAVSWHETLTAVPDDRPLLVVANEYLDALPIRQLVRGERAWHEILVGLDSGGRLALAPSAAPSPLGWRLPDLPRGSVVELAPAREAAMAELAARVVHRGGLALVIDYGELEPAPGSTLQAVAGHRKVAPLTRPGEVDLTARVAFAPLLRAARAAGAAVFGPIPQARFLARLGIDRRLERLVAGASADAADRLRRGHARLTAPAAMGELFQVVALAGPGAPPPSGFVAAEAARA